MKIEIDREKLTKFIEENDMAHCPEGWCIDWGVDELIEDIIKLCPIKITDET